MAQPLRYEFGSKSVLLKYSHGVLSPSPFSRLLASVLVRDFGDRFGGPSDRALDIGSGSGIQGIILALLGVETVFSVDIDPRCVAATEFNALLNGVSEWSPSAQSVSTYLGDMITPVTGLKFDMMVCNPPSLPSGEDTPRFASGGAYPQEFMDRLIHNASLCLEDHGVLVTTVSSLAGLPRTLNKMAESGLAGVVLAKSEEKFRDFYYPHIAYYRRSKLDGISDYTELENGELAETVYVVQATRI